MCCCIASTPNAAMACLVNKCKNNKFSYFRSLCIDYVGGHVEFGSTCEEKKQFFRFDFFCLFKRVFGYVCARLLIYLFFNPCE